MKNHTVVTIYEDNSKVYSVPMAKDEADAHKIALERALFGEVDFAKVNKIIIVENLPLSAKLMLYTEPPDVSAEHLILWVATNLFVMVEKTTVTSERMVG
jgi:hypothetical protein